MKNSIFEYESVIDNRSQHMDIAISTILSNEDQLVRHFDIGVGYFYLSGLLLISDAFTSFMNKRNGTLRIIMGKETNQPTLDILKSSYKENYKKELKKNVKSDAEKISKTNSTFILQFIQWIKQGRIEVKVYTGNGNYFHAKSYLFYSKREVKTGQVIVGSSNFSQLGLKGNTELNVYSQDNYKALQEWFSMLWNSNEVENFNEELIDVIENTFPSFNRLQMYKPTRETYYEFAQLFSHSYKELSNTGVWLNLYPHQKSGVVKIFNKLNTYGTAVLSDGVGLGKTRTAAGVISLFKENENNAIPLLIVDTKLQEQWKEELTVLGISSEEYILQSRQRFVNLSDSDRKNILAKVKIVVIDEAHIGFKNRASQSYRNLRELILTSDYQIKGLLLTATPWNNKREDVIHLGSLFLNPMSIPQDRKYKQFFLRGSQLGKTVNKLAKNNEAFNDFWRDLFLQRTRKTYGGEDVTFAKRHFPAVEIHHDPNKIRIFSENFEIISELHFPYMDVMRHIHRNKNQIGTDTLRMMMLKRADSSWKAFVDTLENTLTKEEKFLNEVLRIKNSKDSNKLFKVYLNEIINAEGYIEKNKLGHLDLEEDQDLKKFEDISHYRKFSYIREELSRVDALSSYEIKEALKQMVFQAKLDINRLTSLINRVKRAYKENDEKYEQVKEQFLKELDAGNKVILVSQFTSTAEYYYKRILNENIIQKKRIGLVTGNDKRNLVGEIPATKNEILNRFSPESKNKQEYILKDEQLSLIVGTDTISTGQNLQDSVVLMNLELPYNPMVLEQRIGRIDRPRPKQQVGEINIYTFPSMESIDSELKMTERVGQKMIGVYEDTRFDSIVLPSYQKFLKEAQKNRNSIGLATSNMVEEELLKYQYGSGMETEEHSMEYENANKRLFNFQEGGIKKLEKLVHSSVSFSTGDSIPVAVIKISYCDANGVPIKEENKIIKADSLEEVPLVMAENALYGEINHSILDTSNLDINKSLFKIKELERNISSLLQIYVKQYNKSVEDYNNSLDSMSNSVSKDAASKIMNSIRGSNQDFILSRMNEIGFNPKDIKLLVKKIQYTSKEETDLFEAVKEISQDINQFWWNFKEYVTLFDLNINNNTLEKIEEPKRKIANIEESKLELLIANITNCN